jgi:cell division protein FtsN
VPKRPAVQEDPAPAAVAVKPAAVKAVAAKPVAHEAAHHDAAAKAHAAAHHAEKSQAAKATKTAAVKAAPVKAASAKPAESKPVEAASPDGTHWIVQLGAFESHDHADLLVNTLEAHGQAAKIKQGIDGAGKGWYFVQTPPYSSAAAARSAAHELGGREHVPTYLIKVPPSDG